MGDVAIQYRLLPESPDADLEVIGKKIQAALPDGVRLHKMEAKPFAFGLTAIEILVVTNDKSGLSEKTESNLASIEGIQSIELVEMSLIN